MGPRFARRAAGRRCRLFACADIYENRKLLDREDLSVTALPLTKMLTPGERGVEGTLFIFELSGMPLARYAGTGAWIACTPEKEATRMLWTVFMILMILWLVGMVAKVTLGGFLHVLLLLAVVTILIRLFEGRRAV